ncbi:MAG: hypothetical protein MI919_08055 [Holophagales bacterium]|nr:hypothetical protein [Holophagales bacterium]
MSPTGASSAHTWLARLGLQVRVGEGGLFTLLFGAHFLLLAFQYTAKSVRQSTFIDVLGAENLPWAYLLVAVASYPLLLLFGRLSARHDLSRVLTVASLVAAVSLLAFAWIFLVFPHASWPTLVFYLWTAVVGVLLVSQFWSYAAARLDARQARRLFAPVGAGGILGSIAGGQLARLGTLGPERWHGWGAQGALILGAGVLVLLAAVLTLSRRGPSLAAPEPPRLDPRAGKNLVRRSRYVQLISAATLLSALVAQVVDLQFAWVLEERTQDLAERTAAYGNL